MKITLDAKEKSLGRLASEAAAILLGKKTIGSKKHLVLPVTLEIVNASYVRITGSKTKTKIYTRYSGYPGGLKRESFTHMIKKFGYGGAIKHAVAGMLPKNKLRGERLKNLRITE